MAETLGSPTWVSNLRQQLHGRSRLILDDIHPYAAGASFIARVVEDAARDCGASIGSNSDPSNIHFVWVVPVKQPDYDTIYAKVREISGEFGGLFDAQAHEIANDAKDRVDGFGVYNATVVGSDNKSISMVFINENALTSETSIAFIEYAVFSGLTASVNYDVPVDNNKFSYLVGGGKLSDVAGDSDSHYAKLCRVIPIIKSTCNNTLENIKSISDIRDNLSSIDNACQQDAKIVVGLKNADDVIQKHGGRN